MLNLDTDVTYHVTGSALVGTTVPDYSSDVIIPATLNLAAGAFFDGDLVVGFDCSGVLNVLGPASVSSLVLAQGPGSEGTLNVLPNASLDVIDTLSFGVGHATVYNEGLVTQNGPWSGFVTWENGPAAVLSLGASPFTFSGDSIRNRGTVVVDTPTQITFNLPIINEGIFRIQQGRADLLQSLVCAPASTIDSLPNAEARLYGEITGTLRGTSDGWIRAGSQLNISTNGAILDFTGVNGFRWSETVVVPQDTQLVNNGLITTDLVGGQGLTGHMVNNGEIIIDSTWGYSSYFSDATFENNGVLELRRFSGGWSEWTGNNIVNNIGTMLKTTSGSATISIPINNSGVIEAQSGTLSLLKGLSGTPSGLISVSSGAEVKLYDTLAGTIRGTSDGVLRAGSTINIDIDGATLELGGEAGFWWRQTFAVPEGSQLVNNGLITTDLVGGLGLAGHMVNNGEIIIDSTWGYSSYFSDATFENNGVLELRRFSGGWSEWTGNNIVSNSGTLLKTGQGGASIWVPIQNTGVIDVQEGTLYVSGITQYGGSLEMNANIWVSGDLQILGGQMTGSGSINGKLSNLGGTLKLGDDFGELAISSNYTQGASASVEVDLGGDAPGEYDRLSVSGTASLNGTLIINFASGFVPVIGQTAEIIFANNRVGTFSGVQVTNSPSGFGVSVCYSATGVSLSIVESSAAVAHDSDGDHDLDLRDFAGFQACFDPSGLDADPVCLATFDNDAAGVANGLIDLDDYSSFLNTFFGPSVESAVPCDK
ncbi:MAG: hypothetical protein KDA54_09050 [Phycisphaerales bacterium]|nr:hypothetical protein [Phycisphaerales bacterium]